MEFKPHDYQQYAIEYIETHEVAAVLLDMGLGKTAITLTALYDLLFDYFEITRVLVIAPLRVARNTWPQEIEKWDHLKDIRYSVAVGTEKERLEAFHRDADIYIINRENVQWMVENSDKKSSGSKRVDTGISCPTGRPYATLYYVYREQGAAPKA